MFNVKIAATLMVALMMFSGAAVMVGTEDNALDAVVGDGGAYSYTLTYHSDQMANTAAQELQLTVADMTPISHAPSTTSATSLANEGSWGFNTTTGIGPFNSFYAVFDPADNNSFVSILNPYDFSKKIDGTSIDNLSDYNIMWVLPTVYWSVDNSGNVTLTNDPNSGGVAYAHTIDGTVYNYLALGVYEATLSNSMLLSKSGGVIPTSSKTLEEFRTAANGHASSLGSNAHSMVWNYYQYELYKLCSLTVTEGFYSQNIVGNGWVYGNGSAKSAGYATDSGPYFGNPAPMSSTSNAVSYGQSAVILFIENAWGSLQELVDGAFIYDSKLYLDSRSVPDKTDLNSEYVGAFTVNDTTGYQTAIYMTPQIWGLGDGIGTGHYMNGITDGNIIDTTNGEYVVVGGKSGNSTTTFPWHTYGLSYFETVSNSSNSSTGTRLAFVFNSLYGSNTVSIDVNDSDYGSVSSASITDIEPGDSITIDGDTITYGETTVTATANVADAQYTYAFAGWYDGDTLLEDGELQVDSSLTITAMFTATTNQYVVTISPNDPSYGSVSPSSLTVDYGTAITVSGTSLTIGSTAVTATASDATAQYTYAFDSWTVPGAVETVTGPITITGTFTATVNEYTVTIESVDVTLGTVDVSEVQDVPYGTVITVSGDTITIGETVITATVIGDGLVTKWSVSDGATVKGDMTITASFVEPSSIENTLMGLLPFLLIIVLVITAAGGVFASGGDPESLIKLIICLAVGVIVISVFVLPIAGGL